MRAPSLLLAAALALGACARPEPPRLTPLAAKLTRIGPAGIDVVVTLEADNPNGFSISAQSMTAKILLDGKVNAGTVTTKTALVIPAHGKVKADVPLSTSWNNVGGVAALAANNRDVPYTIDGTVALGSESLNVDVPFHIAGIITREQLVQVAVDSLPKLLPSIPGLPLPR